MDHMIDDSDRLKPCPFCGGEAVTGCIDTETQDHPDEGGHFISCNKCGASTGLRFACGEDPLPLLMEAWNKRTHDAEAIKSELRALVFGDIVHSQVLAMQAAVLEGYLKTPAHGMQWIVNTLTGPGHLPDLDEARALGGAQAWFDRETAKHEDFRAAHPGPAALGPNVQGEPHSAARTGA